MMIIGAVSAHTPVGLTAVQTGFLARAGAVGLRESPLPDPEGKKFSMGVVPVVPPGLQGTQRMEAMALRALTDLFAELPSHIGGLRLRMHLMVDEFYASRSAYAPAGTLDESETQSTGSLERALRNQVRALLGADPKLDVHPVGGGGGATVLSSIAEQLEHGICDAVLFGGVHTDCEPSRIASLWQSGRIYSSDNRDGLMPGEGAAFALLLRPDTARSQRLPAWAVVRSFAAGFESARIDNDDSAFEARGLCLAVRQALQGLQRSSVGWLMNDLSFEALRAYELQVLLARFQNLLGPPQVMGAPAQSLGYQGGAMLPLHLALAAEAWRRGYAPSPVLLSTTGSDTGARSAVVVSDAR